MKLNVQKFNDDFNRDKDTLIRYMNDELMSPIVKWFMEMHGDPTVWMDNLYYEDMHHISGFISVMHNIHHALVDDGEMCFPIVDGIQKLSFLDEYEYIRIHGGQVVFAENIQSFFKNIEKDD